MTSLSVGCRRKEVRQDEMRKFDFCAFITISFFASERNEIKAILELAVAQIRNTFQRDIVGRLLFINNTVNYYLRSPFNVQCRLRNELQ